MATKGTASTKILLTFTGSHDPFGATSSAGDNETGPVLTVAAERQFDRVYLFGTPPMHEITVQTRDELIRRHKGLVVEVCDVPLKDPTNYLGILKQLRVNFKRINKDFPKADYFICVSSGTPHMHASWLMLAASGEIPARILQTRARRFVSDGDSRVTEIDFTNAQFPQIKPFGALPDADAPAELGDLRSSLGIIGEHDSFLRPLTEAFTLARYNEPLLLLGETGVGKEVFASLVHHASDRSGRSFLTINCAGLTEQLIESQLFGHKRGSFSGAHADHVGYFQTAEGGTLFLDELGEMPTTSQAKLLRAIQQGKIQRLGESRDTKVDVRVIAATNLDIQQAIAEKRLRQDLYFRFKSRVRIPPLRERRSDIPRLASFFLDRWNDHHKQQRRLSKDAVIALSRHPWPGNVRELEGVISTSAALCKGAVIEAEALIFDNLITAPTVLPEPHPGFKLNAFLDDTRRQLTTRAMDIAGGNRTKAAELLDISPQAMSQYLLKQQ